MSGIGRIEAERQRQIEKEKWTAAHDNRHKDGCMAAAAACYANLASAQERMELHVIPDGPLPVNWPWSPIWWKPSADPIRNLEKAGALIAAEIDRLEREGELKQQEGRSGPK